MSPQQSAIDALRAACAASSQKAVAERIGYSTATVSQVLSGTYKGDLNRVYSAIEGAYLAAVVACPILGELPQQECLRHQRQPFNPSNPMRVRLYRACHATCPNRYQKEDAK